MAEGDERAFTQVYDRFYLNILYFTRRYVSEEDAQDITAEAFLQLWRKRRDFPHLEAMAKFLFVTARNKCYDFLKHQKIKLHYSAEIALAMDADRQERDYFEHQLRMDLLELLQAHMDKLPPKVQEIFLLSFKDGLKPFEIAQKMGISVKTVKNQKLSAVKLLKAAVSGHPLEIILLVFLL